MSATQSQVAMFRGLVAMAWADHALSAEEQQRFETLVNNNVLLSASQKQQVVEEIHTPVHIDLVWPQITDKHDRAHLLNVASTIFVQDGEYCEDEKAIYEKIYASHMSSLPQAELEKDIIAMAQAQRLRSEAYKEERYKNASIAGKIAIWLEDNLGIHV